MVVVRSIVVSGFNSSSILFKVIYFTDFTLPPASFAELDKIAQDVACFNVIQIYVPVMFNQCEHNHLIDENESFHCTRYKINPIHLKVFNNNDHENMEMQTNLELNLTEIATDCSIGMIVKCKFRWEETCQTGYSEKNLDVPLNIFGLLQECQVLKI